MKTFKNKHFTGKRNYECTNVVACQSTSAPDDNWIECDDSILSKLQKLWIGYNADNQPVQYFGWL